VCLEERASTNDTESINTSLRKGGTGNAEDRDEDIATVCGILGPGYLDSFP
jgi:hypothetical protein